MHDPKKWTFWIIKVEFFLNLTPLTSNKKTPFWTHFAIESGPILADLGLVWKTQTFFVFNPIQSSPPCSFTNQKLK